MALLGVHPEVIALNHVVKDDPSNIDKARKNEIIATAPFERSQGLSEIG